MQPCSHRFAGGGCSLGLPHTSCRSCPSYTPRRRHEKPLQRVPASLPSNILVDKAFTPTDVPHITMADMIKEQEQAVRHVAATTVRGGCNCGKH